MLGCRHTLIDVWTLNPSKHLVGVGSYRCNVRSDLMESIIYACSPLVLNLKTYGHLFYCISYREPLSRASVSLSLDRRRALVLVRLLTPSLTLLQSVVVGCLVTVARETAYSLTCVLPASMTMCVGSPICLAFASNASIVA